MLLVSACFGYPPIKAELPVQHENLLTSYVYIHNIQFFSPVLSNRLKLHELEGSCLFERPFVDAVQRYWFGRITSQYTATPFSLDTQVWVSHIFEHFDNHRRALIGVDRKHTLLRWDEQKFCRSVVEMQLYALRAGSRNNREFSMNTDEINAQRRNFVG